MGKKPRSIIKIHNPALPRKKGSCASALAIVGATVVMVACKPTPPPPSPAPTTPVPTASSTALHRVHDPGRVTGTLQGPCAATDAPGGILPDPHCTPGAYDPAITAAILCAPGYRTSTYRAPESQTEHFKFDEAIPAYSQQGQTGELDHLVPLELGGANDASNLWLQPGPIPNTKDHVELVLHDWVCAGSSNIAQDRLTRAQVAVAQNWTTAEKVLGISS